MSNSSDFFQVGGTLSEDAPSYIERPADTELLAALERHQFCLVLAPRQMGKSSLMIHAIARLKKKGVSSAVVDLQLLGSETDLERWFLDVVYQIKRTARLKTNAKEWWHANKHLGPTQRFISFLEDVVLTEISGDVVLFFDEIDSVLNLPFSDDFFTTIRSLYNSRAVHPALKRLSVVLLGVATASSFIKDRTRTPFNIGESITLTDFPKEKTKPFQEVLGAGSEELVNSIFYWTNGQPLLVQKLAAAAYSWPPDERSPERVNDEVKQSYLQLKIEQDTHLKFIQDYLLDAPSNIRKTLGIYRDVITGKHVENNEQSPEQDRLKLAGVVKVENGLLAPRNLIYQNIFNFQWVQEHIPVDYRKWATYGTFASVVILSAGLLLAFFMSSAMRGRGAPGTGRPLRVGITQWPGYAGGIVANNGLRPNKECIYWNKHKILVEFVLLEDPAKRVEAFAKGGDDGGVDIVWSSVSEWAIELPGLVKSGIRARAIMQVDWSTGADAIIADESIKKIEDLKGKQISLVKSTPSHWLLEYSMKNSALSEEEQKQIEDNLVGKDDPGDARYWFVSNKVNATVVWGPEVTHAMERPGAHKLVTTETDNNLIADIMVAREDFIKDHQDVIKAFIQGWLEGTDTAKREPDRAAELLVDNETLYRDLGVHKTLDALATVTLADIAENNKMFGLDGGSSLFDIIFNEAGAIWLKRGYITQALAADQAREFKFLKQIQEEFAARSAVSGMKPPSPEIINKPPIVTKHVYLNFAAGSATLDEQAQKIIDGEVALLVQANSNAYIRIEGNTDVVFGAGNEALSLARAQAVANYLTEQYKMDKNRFIVVGNGARNPLQPNTTEQGRAANRRIDVGIVPVN